MSPRLSLTVYKILSNRTCVLRSLLWACEWIDSWCAYINFFPFPNLTLVIVLWKVLQIFHLCSMADMSVEINWEREREMRRSTIDYLKISKRSICIKKKINLHVYIFSSNLYYYYYFFFRCNLHTCTWIACRYY